MVQHPNKDAKIEKSFAKEMEEILAHFLEHI